jgi:peroxiredoxin
MVEVGETAPDFTLQGVDSWRIETFTLSEYLQDGGFVVLTFYVYDFSPVCTEQMCELDNMDIFETFEGVRLLGVAPDGPFAHKEFIDQHDISFPLLCDTAERVAEDYGVLYEELDGFERVPQRSMFLLDGDRRVREKWVTEDNWDDWTNEPLRRVKATIENLHDP